MALENINIRQVWRTPKAGAIQRLVLVEEPLAELKSDEVQVDVKAVGLNFADIFALTGLYSATPKVQSKEDYLLLLPEG